MDKSRTLEIISKITNFEVSDGDKLRKPFVIVGPSGSSDNELRVYCNGGLMGTIGISDPHCTLFSIDYVKNHISNVTDKDTANELLKRSKSNEDIIYSAEYLNIAYKASKNKFGNDKEKNIQTQILKEYIKNQEKSWFVLGIETGINDELNPGSTIIKNVKKPDFVVYDKVRKQFGIIELKYNNKSVNNLGEHYDSFFEVFQNPNYFIAEMCRRAKVMEEYKLIDSCISGSKVEIEEINKVWFGFLFVKGGKPGAVKSTKNYITKKMSNGNVSEACRFLYVDSVDQLDKTGLSFDEMQSYEEFIN